MNRIKWLLIAGAAVGLSGLGLQASYAEESNPGDLDQRLRVIERKLELDAEAAEEKKKTAISPQAGPDGIGIKSADGNFAIKFRGVIQADSRTFFDDQRIPLTNKFLMRRVRPIIEGSLFRDYDFNITPDFAGSAASLIDAYIDYHPAPWLRIRAGKLKPFVGLERYQSIANSFFTELALPSALVPNRDVGLQAHGEIAGGVLNYSAGIFTGTQDGANNDTDNNDSKDVAARIFTQPFKQAYSDWVRDLGFGVAGTFGNRLGTPSAYRTSGQNAFFTYLSTVSAEGTQWRVVPQLTYYKGKFGLLGEYAVSTTEIKRGTALTWLSNNAWQAAVSWVVTDDKASFKGISPKKPFDVKARQWGAWEIAARYHELNVDSSAFDGGNFALLSSSAKKASAWTVGVNWWLNRFVKTQVDYEETSFEGGAAGNRDREKEKLLSSRFQVAF